MAREERFASRAGERSDQKTGAPCILVIFGASGDLTKRKLIPALYNLGRQRLLHQGFAVLGFARTESSSQRFREQMRRELASYAGKEFDPALWDWLEGRLHYLTGDVDLLEDVRRLSEKLEEIRREHDTKGNAVFYLAIAPDLFARVVHNLEEAGLTQEENGRFRRVIVEKPFGHDLDSARALNEGLRRVLRERQIYRIDHYLGKETVQNLLVFRFSNGIFEPIWNRRYVDHVQITVAETLGVESRGNYYDRAGALRDMVPNHLFQLISLVAMEPPVSFEADAVRDEQSKVLRAIQPMTQEEVLSCAVRGQYGAGTVEGRELPDYRSEPNVDSLSNTETFVAMKLDIDSWRWKDVPFYLRVGKAMKTRASEITVGFKKPPFVLFRNTSIEELTPNELVVNVQPDEGIQLHFNAKVPGATMKIGGVDMDFSYAEHFGRAPATGYERLLYDAMLGDQTLFQRADMVEIGWSVVTPVLDVWQALPARDFPNSPAGSFGPKEADLLLERDGRRWRNPEP